MSTPIRSVVPALCLHRIAAAFRLLRPRGALLDGPARIFATGPAGTAGGGSTRAVDASLMALFVTRVRELLGADDETDRRRLEADVLALASPLQVTGLFDVLHIAHPAVAAMVADHLAEPASD
jgi:hypothetical protein